MRQTPSPTPPPHYHPACHPPSIICTEPILFFFYLSFPLLTLFYPVVPFSPRTAESHRFFLRFVLHLAQIVPPVPPESSLSLSLFLLFRPPTSFHQSPIGASLRSPFLAYSVFPNHGWIPVAGKHAFHSFPPPRPDGKGEAYAFAYGISRPLNSGNVSHVGADTVLAHGR